MKLKGYHICVGSLTILPSQADVHGTRSGLVILMRLQHPEPAVDVDNLLNLGFVDIGTWVHNGDWLAYQLDGVNAEANAVLLDKPNALYAFARETAVLYIGKTARSIRKRFTGYSRPGPSQSTNIRCHGHIKQELSRGNEIRILVFAPISDLRYAEFEINLAAGLEDSLIRRFNPPWNGGSRGQPISESAEREQDDLTAEPAPEIAVARATAQPSLAKFDITLGATYYYKGLVNPGVQASNFLGQGGDPVRIIFDDGTEPIVSTINRTANSNGAVRVIGCNQDIAKWFQRNFREGETVQGEVLDAHTIRLRSAATDTPCCTPHTPPATDATTAE